MFRMFLLNEHVTVWQAFKGKLDYNTWYDPCKCHAVHALHWLVNQGYKCLMTDAIVPVKGSLLTDQGLPPRERVSLEEAKTWFTSIGAGKNTILDTFGKLGCYHVVMWFPERTGHHLVDLALSLTNLAQLYCAQKHGLVPSEWT